MWSTQNQAEKTVRAFWKAEPVSVAIGWDEFCVGVKGQSNMEIAGFLRNLCQQSVLIEILAGKALIKIGGLVCWPVLVKLWIAEYFVGQTDSGRKGPKSNGKQPKRSNKVPKAWPKCKRLFEILTFGRLAWKQPPFKESVTAHQIVILNNRKCLGLKAMYRINCPELENFVVNSSNHPTGNVRSKGQR